MKSVLRSCSYEFYKLTIQKAQVLSASVISRRSTVNWTANVNHFTNHPLIFVSRVHMSGSSSTNPRSDITKLAFYGRDANECEEFIASVRYFAFFDNTGRVIGDAWRLGLATSCLRGDALRWHASLDKTIRQDWDLFVEALLENYPRIPNPESSS